MRFLLILLVFLVTPALAQNKAPTSGQYRSWAAFSYTEGKTTTCYAVARPQLRKGVSTKAESSYIYITHRPAEGSYSVFNYDAGQPLSGGTATLMIDKNKFTLFTDATMAWAQGTETDRAITMALRKGSKVVVTATDGDGKTITDTFSLAGSGQALQAIDKMCN